MKLTLTARAPIPWWMEVIGVLIGIPWALFFARILYIEVTDVSRGHGAHEALFCFMFLLGASIAIGRWFLFPVIQVALNFYGDYRQGGRRHTDKYPMQPPGDAK